MSSGESLAHTINDTIKLLCMLLIKFVDFFWSYSHDGQATDTGRDLNVETSWAPANWAISSRLLDSMIFRIIEGFQIEKWRAMDGKVGVISWCYRTQSFCSWELRRRRIFIRPDVFGLETYH